MEDSEALKIKGKVLRQILDESPVVGYAMQQRVSQIFFKRYLNAMERLETVAKESSAPIQSSGPVVETSWA
jgi:CRP-like cAMP-binding protein